MSWMGVRPTDVDPEAPPVVVDLLDRLAEADLLRQLTLPWTEAGRLLTLLADNFVQGATVFAGYPGIVQSLRERVWRA